METSSGDDAEPRIERHVITAPRVAGSTERSERTTSRAVTVDRHDVVSGLVDRIHLRLVGMAFVVGGLILLLIGNVI